MKKIITFIALSIILTSCDFDKLTSVQDDFAITVEAEPVLSKVSIQVYNSANGEDIPDNVEVTFTGENANQILSLSGAKNFKVDNGFVTVGVNRNFAVSEENPLNVTANFSSNGFVSKQIDVSFDGSDISDLQVSLLERANLPDAITLKSETKSLKDNKTTEELVISVDSNNDSEESLQVTVPEGTEFVDEDGNVLSGGELTVDVQTFDLEEPDIESLTEETSNPEQLPSGLNEFPGSLELDSDETSGKYASKESLNNGTYLVPIRSQPCMYFYVNGRRAWGRSRTFSVRTLIYSSTINPNTNQRIKVGDKIAVYRKVGRRNVKLTDAIVQAYPWSSRYVQISFGVPGSGIYPYGFEVAPSCNQITAPINFVNNGRRSFYFYKVSHKSNPGRALRWGRMFFNGTYQVNNRNIWWYNNRALRLLKDDMILKIYNYSYQERRYKVVYNKEISKCDLSGTTIDISNTDCFKQRDMDLSLECPDATYLLNRVRVYYRPTTGSRRYWRFFDNVYSSRLTGQSPCLEDGVKYEFGFWYDGWRVTPALTESQILDLYQNFDLDAICKTIKDNL